jgi:AAA15 family ATPase/GTPase
MSQIDKYIFDEMKQKYSGEIIKCRAKILALEKKDRETIQLIETLDMKLYLLREQMKDKNIVIESLQKKIHNTQYKNNHK